MNNQEVETLSDNFVPKKFNTNQKKKEYTKTEIIQKVKQNMKKHKTEIDLDALEAVSYIDIVNAFEMPDSFQDSDDFLYLCRTVVLNFPQFAVIDDFGLIMKKCIEEYVEQQMVVHKNRIHVYIDLVELVPSNWKDTRFGDTVPRDCLVYMFTQEVKERYPKISLERFFV